MQFRDASIALAMALAGFCGSAQASTVPFTGTIQNVTPPGAPGGRCGSPPVLTLVFAPEHTSGTSNIGTFTASASHCVTPTPPVTTYGGGQFSWEFANGDVLQGTYTGTVTLVPGQPARTEQDYVVTGGSGRFEGAKGLFSHVGTFVFGAGGVTTGNSTFKGTLCLAPGPRKLSLEDFRTVGGKATPPTPSIDNCLSQIEKRAT